MASPWISQSSTASSGNGSPWGKTSAAPASNGSPWGGGSVQQVPPEAIVAPAAPKVASKPPAPSLLGSIWGGITSTVEHIAQDVTGAATSLFQKSTPDGTTQFQVPANATDSQKETMKGIIGGLSGDDSEGVLTKFDNLFSNAPASLTTGTTDTAKQAATTGIGANDTILTSPEFPGQSVTNSSSWVEGLNIIPEFLGSFVSLLIDVASSFSQAVTGSPLPQLKIPEIAGGQGNIIDTESAIQDYMGQIQSGVPESQAFWNAAINAVGNIAGAVMMLDGFRPILKGAVVATAPESLVTSTSKQVVSGQDFRDYISGRKSFIDPDLPREARDAISEAISSGSRAMKEKLLDGVSITNVKPSILGRLLGVTEDEAKALLTKTVPSVVFKPAEIAGPKLTTEEPVAGGGETKFPPEPAPAITSTGGTGDIVTPESYAPEEGILTEYSSGSAVGERDFVPTSDTEAGFINPATIGTDIKDAVTNAKEFLEETQKGIQRGSEIADDFYKLKQSSTADLIRAKQMLENSKIPADMPEKFYNYEEDSTITLSPSEQEIYDKEILPLKQATDKMYADITNEGIPLTKDDYTPRIVKNKRSIIDRIESGLKKSTQQGGILSKSAGFFKKRTIKALVAEDGSRSVVSIKPRTTKINGKTIRNNDVIKLSKGSEPENLGSLKIKSKSDLLDKEVKPIQNKLAKIQKYLDILKNLKEPVSDTELRNLDNDINSLAKEIDTHVGVYSQKELSQIMGKLKFRESKLDTLAKVNKEGQGPKSIARKIKNAESKMLELVNYMADIENKYNPEELDNKVFIDKDGNQYRIKDATTKEIEANTDVTYHKNVQVNRTLTYLKLRQIDRAIQFMEQLKASPDFGDFAMKTGEANTPEGWKAVSAPQFKGYVFSPHVADAINQFTNNMKDDVLGALTAVNHLALDVIFFNPVTHLPNLTTNWLVNRGVSKFLIPPAYKQLANNFAKAYTAISTQNQDFIDMLQAGAPLMSANKTQSDVTTLLLGKIKNEIINDPVKGDLFAKAFGYVNPLALAKALTKFSDKVTWVSNDLFTMQAIYERMDAGDTMEQAIAHVGKYIPNYRLPAKIVNSAIVNEIMTNPDYSNFSSYHYGVYKTLGNLALDAGLGSGKEKLEAMDKFAMMGLLGLSLAYLFDPIAKKLTGNKKSYVRTAGVLSPTYDLYKLSTGQMALTSYLESIVTPAQATEQAAELFFNKDFYTGDNIYSYLDLTKNPARAADDVASWEANNIEGLLSLQELGEGKQTVPQAVMSLAGVYSPNTTPDEQAVDEMRFNQLPKLQTQVKQQYISGDEDAAISTMTQYNDQIINYFMQSAKEEGTPITRDEAIQGLNRQEALMKPPKGATLDRYKTKSTLNFVQKYFVK